MNENKKKLGSGGFTLIEILVIVVIIGLLAMVILVSMIGTKNRSRISNFKKQVASIQRACSIECTKVTPLAVTAPSPNYTSAASYTCGCVTGGSFSISVIAGNQAAGLTCTATVNERGVTSAGPDC